MRRKIGRRAFALLVQELVKPHGGLIRVESVVDEGTTFIVGISLGSSHLSPEQVGDSKSSPATAIGTAPFVGEAFSWLPDVKDQEKPGL